jgi:hypothetical protein
LGWSGGHRSLVLDWRYEVGAVVGGVADPGADEVAGEAVGGGGEEVAGLWRSVVAPETDFCRLPPMTILNWTGMPCSRVGRS